MIKNPSKYQVDIFSAYKTTNKNLVIKATAGSGKTTTIIELLHQTPRYLKTILLAYNKSIAEDIKKKVQPNIDVKTVHSLGCGLLYKYYPFKLKITEFKNYSIAKKSMKFDHVKKDKEGIYIFNLSKMIDIYRINLFSQKSELKDYLDYIGFPTLNGRDFEDGWKLLNKVNEYNSVTEHKEFMIDFTDMLYLPIKEGLQFPKYDVTFIDEVQDISKLQKKLIDNIIKRNGRFVAVGDERQSIYQFIGANIDSFNEFKNSPNTINLPLSVSYRCSKNVVQYANTIFKGEIEAFEGNPDGEVRFGNLLEANDGDFVLCRNNMPLVEAYIYYLANKKKSVIYGKDLGKTLQLLASKFAEFDSSIVTQEMDNFLIKIKDELLEKGVVNYKNNSKYVNAEENIAILKILIGKFGSITNVNNHLEEIYSDDIDSKGIILSTIHRSKGLEAENVFAYKYHELLPCKHAITDEELYAEECLKFVCATRAKKNLIFVN